MFFLSIISLCFAFSIFNSFYFPINFLCITLKFIWADSNYFFILDIDSFALFKFSYKIQFCTVKARELSNNQALAQSKQTEVSALSNFQSFIILIPSPLKQLNSVVESYYFCTVREWHVGLIKADNFRLFSYQQQFFTAFLRKIFSSYTQVFYFVSLIIQLFSFWFSSLKRITRPSFVLLIALAKSKFSEQVLSFDLGDKQRKEEHSFMRFSPRGLPIWNMALENFQLLRFKNVGILLLWMDMEFYEQRLRIIIISNKAIRFISTNFRWLFKSWQDYKPLNFAKIIPILEMTDLYLSLSAKRSLFDWKIMKIRFTSKINLGWIIKYLSNQMKIIKISELFINYFDLNKKL